MSVIDHSSVTAALADFVTTEGVVPVSVLARARARVLSTLVGSLAGAADETTVRIIRTVSPTLGPANPAASILGTGLEGPRAWAAFFNTVSAERAVSNGLGITDGGAPHAAIVAGACAVAAEDTSDRRLLEAVAVGTEVATRLSASFAADRGIWDIEAVASRFGTTAAVGRLLGLTAECVVMAFGIAGGESGGLSVATGSDAAVLQRARSAFDAVEACLIARAGYDASMEIVEGVGGAGLVLFPSSDYASVPLGLNRDWDSAPVPSASRDLADFTGLLSSQVRVALDTCLSKAPPPDSLHQLFRCAAHSVSPAYRETRG